MRFLNGLLLLSILSNVAAVNAANPVIDVGSRRQLFVDGHLIERMVGSRQVLHHPVRREVAIKIDYPWEQGGIWSMVTFKDGDKFRAWYRVDTKQYEAGNDKGRKMMTAYAESDDGIHWHKPMLGIIEFNGSKQNNLVWNGKGHSLSPFKDGNPNCKPEEKYKGVVSRGLIFRMVSPDGLHWKRFLKNTVFPTPPADSHNIIFWDEPTQQYVVYGRMLRKDGVFGRGMAKRHFVGNNRWVNVPARGVRWIRRGTSKDFENWTEAETIQTGDAPLEELYTNSTVRYRRAPDYFLMFPSRFATSRMSDPNWKFGAGVCDIPLLTSRDGVNFDRTFMEAFLRPGLDANVWHERSLRMERGILETSPTELSMYAMEHSRLPSSHFRRLTLRPDGFISVQAPYAGGELITTPIKFSGQQLRLNYSTSAVGSVRVEIQDTAGKAFPGFQLENCKEHFGDNIDGSISWKSKVSLQSLAGKTIRLRFVMSDADLYAFRFVK